MDKDKILIKTYEFINSLCESKLIGTRSSTSSHRDTALQALSKDILMKLKASSSSSSLRAFNDLKERFRKQFVKLVKEYMNEQDAAEREKREMVYGKGHLYNRLKGLIRGAYIEAFLHGVRYTGIHKAGIPTLTKSDSDWIESAVRHELQFVRKFVDDIDSKRVRDPGRMDVKRRIDMYVDSLDSVFEAGKAMGHPPKTLFYWIAREDKVVCPECKLLAKFSPYTRDNLPTTVRAGATRCLTNCRCKIYTKIVSDVEYSRTKSINYSKSYFLDLLRRSRRNELPKYYYG